jgi:hypothetical protein
VQLPPPLLDPLLEPLLDPLLDPLLEPLLLVEPLLEPLLLVEPLLEPLPELLEPDEDEHATDPPVMITVPPRRTTPNPMR